MGRSSKLWLYTVLTLTLAVSPNFALAQDEFNNNTRGGTSYGRSYSEPEPTGGQYRWEWTQDPNVEGLHMRWCRLANTGEGEFAIICLKDGERPPGLQGGGTPPEGPFLGRIPPTDPPRRDCRRYANGTVVCQNPPQSGHPAVGGPEAGPPPAQPPAQPPRQWNRQKPACTGGGWNTATCTFTDDRGGKWTGPQSIECPANNYPFRGRYQIDPNSFSITTQAHGSMTAHATLRLRQYYPNTDPPTQTINIDYVLQPAYAASKAPNSYCVQDQYNLPMRPGY